MDKPPLYRLADLLLDGGVVDFISHRRDDGRSWRLIARDMWEQTDGQIDVTHQTVRNWWDAREEIAA